MMFIKPRFTQQLVPTGIASYHYRTGNSLFQNIDLWQFPFQTQSLDASQEVRNIFKKIWKDLHKETFVSPLKYRLPVPNTDWGWLLPRLQQQSPLFF